METKRKRFIVYWIMALFFSIVFGEIMGPVLAGNPLPLLQFPVAFLIYYGVLSFIFALLFYKINKNIVYVIIFIYGVAVEYFFFKNVIGLAGVIFFGLYYLFLFGAPYYIVRKIWRAG